MQRLLPSIEYSPNDPLQPITLYAVNDFTTPFAHAKMSWTISQPGKPDSMGGQTVEIPADGVIRVVTLGSIPALSDPKGKIEVSITSASGEALARSSLGHDDFLQPRSD